METLKEKIKKFNALSRNTEDHFKLCTCEENGVSSYELRLCSYHPRFITCTVDITSIHLAYHGPSPFFRTFGQDDDSLTALLKFLHLHQDYTSDNLIEWEFEDWTSAGYPCKMYDPPTPILFPDLGLSPEDLWCIDEYPSIVASICS